MKHDCCISARLKEDSNESKQHKQENLEPEKFREAVPRPNAGKEREELGGGVGGAFFSISPGGSQEARRNREEVTGRLFFAPLFALNSFLLEHHADLIARRPAV